MNVNIEALLKYKLSIMSYKKKDFKILCQHFLFWKLLKYMLQQNKKEKTGIGEDKKSWKT